MIVVWNFWKICGIVDQNLKIFVALLGFPHVAWKVILLYDLLSLSIFTSVPCLATDIGFVLFGKWMHSLIKKVSF